MSADTLRVGGLQPFSTVDWPGHFAGVVFVQGCPWRCGYCHNRHLQAPEPAPGATTWPEIRLWLARRQGLLDAIVFSGGEPTMDPALPAAIADVRALGFKVGLHTAGMSPRRLEAVLPGLDWVGLDVKAPLDDPALHDRITGVRGGAAAVRESMALLQARGLDFECRTTLHPELLDDGSLAAIAAELAAAGVRRYAVQGSRANDRPSAAGEVGRSQLAEPTVAALRERIAQLELRGVAVVAPACSSASRGAI